MKARNASPKVITVAVLAGILTATATLLDRTRVSAFNPQPDPPAFGMLAVTHGQTARLNVVDTMDASTGPCREVELMFLDSEGNIRQRSVQCLMSGHAAFLDLNGNFLEQTDNRAEIRGKVHLINPPERTMTNFVATIEVFDNETGRTSFVLTPPPDPDKK
jgi:hypothetical protein